MNKTMERHDVAIQHFTALLGDPKREVFALTMIGESHEAMGNRAEATRCYQDALKSRAPARSRPRSSTSSSATFSTTQATAPRPSTTLNGSPSEIRPSVTYSAAWRAEVAREPPLGYLSPDHPARLLVPTPVMLASLPLLELHPSRL